ncbi:hypothetical protein [Tessaracoccus caeni]|uniref:hypothetical protein n=1 Tax=Tessaracoccus caeni TaxID=3031239 RepID=UPI0023DB08D6|nr:hypothetical protein [Tessaracoccus caeni]MDF1488571.1 hypothetical protein [Tessaracoccus caeni]
MAAAVAIMITRDIGGVIPTEALELCPDIIIPTPPRSLVAPTRSHCGRRFASE